jgi:hypothetical protein
MPPSHGSLLAPLSHPLVLPSQYLTLIWAAIHVIYERIECTKSQYLREKITRARVIPDLAVFRLEIFSAVSGRDTLKVQTAVYSSILYIRILGAPGQIIEWQYSMLYRCVFYRIKCLTRCFVDITCDYRP